MDPTRVSVFNCGERVSFRTKRSWRPLTATLTAKRSASGSIDSRRRPLPSEETVSGQVARTCAQAVRHLTSHIVGRAQIVPKPEAQMVNAG
jgi:hypothetical protein